MAATFTAERAEFVTATDATAYEIVAAGLGAFTPGANSTLVAFILGAETSDATYDLNSFVSTGMSLTWTQYGTGTAWTNTQFYRLHVFTAQVGSSPSSVATATATWSEGILACCAWIGEWSGVNTTTPIKQSATSDNALGTDASASLSVAPDSDSSTLFVSVQRRSPPAWTPEAGWTEYMDNGVGTPVTALYVAVTDTGADQTFTSTGTDALNLSFIYELDAAGAANNTVTHAAPNLGFTAGTHTATTGGPPATVKAFPSAEGFGAASEGPRGAGTTPTIYHVTSLSDANTPGTFRYACQQTGPRFVVFDVAGTSVAASEILIDSPYIYIAGQTAPNGGFCVRAAAGYKLTVLSIATQHVIIRHIRIRAGFQADQYPSPTAGSAGDNSTCVNHKHLVGGRYCQHVIWDHCSITWGTDGNMQSGHDTKDLTIQRCIISKPLMNAGHSQQPHGRPLNHQYSEDEGNPDDIGNDYGEFSHIRISDHHNIMSHGEERFPQISTGTGWVELTNNVIYRTRDLATQVNTNGNNIPGATKARIVGNYYKTTNTSTANYEVNLTPDPDDRLPDCKVYVYGNVGENRPTDTESHWLSMAPWGRSPAMGGTADGINPDPTTVTDRQCTTDDKPDFPEADIPITETTAAAAYTDLVTNADCGATLPMLDEVDTEIIAEVAANSGTWIDHPGQREDPDDISFGGGYPDLTTGGSSTLWDEPDDPFDYADNGYLNVENDLNALAGDDIPEGGVNTVTHSAAHITLTGGVHVARTNANRIAQVAPNLQLRGGVHAAASSAADGDPIDITEIDVDYRVTVSVGGSLDTVALEGDYLSPVLPIPGDYDASVAAAGTYSAVVAIAGSYDVTITGTGTP